MRTDRHSRLGVWVGGGLAALIPLCFLATLGFVPAGAQAAFPGANGRIAYAHTDRCPGFPLRIPATDTEIFSINPDGSSPANLSNNVCPATRDSPAPPRDQMPAYSPDATRIAFVRAFSDLYVMNAADGSGQRQLTDSPSGSRDLEPSFSPDGTKVVFSRSDQTQVDLWTVDAAGGEPVQLTNTPNENEFSAVYSPDGTKIAFQRSGDLYTVDADGGNPQNITNTPTEAERRPDFSPDGTKIVFDKVPPRDPSGNGPPAQVWSMAAEGGVQVQLTARASTNEDPVFSPDGTKIAFVSDRRAAEEGLNVGLELFTMDADGSNQVRRTSAPARNNFGSGDEDPSWGNPTPVVAPAAGPGAIPPAGTVTPPAGVAKLPDTTRPLFSSLSISPASFRAAGSGASISRAVGTKVSYRLSEAGEVRFKVERASSGRRAGGRCVKPRRSNRRAKKCTRYKVLAGGFAHQGKAGLNRFRFSGRLRGRKLRAGRYHLRGVATDRASNKSALKRARFRIVRR